MGEVVTRQMIQDEISRWKKRPKDTRGTREDAVRAYLVEKIPPEERRIVRGQETVDEIEYIIEDLDSYA